MCSEVEAGNFTTLIYVILSVGKRVLIMKETLWENRLIIAKDGRIIVLNFIVIATIFSGKKMEGLHSLMKSYCLFLTYSIN
jgi:hypothetical protein